MKVSLLVGFLPGAALYRPRALAVRRARPEPALTRIWGLLAIPAVVIFFLGGMAFAFLRHAADCHPIPAQFPGDDPPDSPSSYISFTTGLMFWVGIAFEFPLVIFVLAAIGLVKARTLAQQWRLAVVIIAIVAAAITPTVDPVNMSLVMGPMILLYFLSIGLAALAQRGPGVDFQFIRGIWNRFMEVIRSSIDPSDPQFIENSGYHQALSRRTAPAPRPSSPGRRASLPAAS